MNFNSIFTLVSSAVALILMTATALASNQTSNMAVSATVTAACTISAGALAFGNYTGAQLDGTSTISVTCTSGSPYTIDLDAGTGSGATTTTRKLTSGADTLDYTIYTDSGRSTIWKTGSPNVSGTGTGSAESVTAYGRMPATATPNVGSYTDTVVATITY